jgi:hypothetical protein
MIKCVDKGKWTCIGRSGKPKQAFSNDTKAIERAKEINNKNKDGLTKLVAYKCTNCFQYHLLTVNKNK